MLLNDALMAKIHDIRLRDRLIAEGKITREEMEKVLKNLADDAENLESIQTGQK